MGDKEDDGSKLPQTLSGRKAQKLSDEEVAEAARVKSGIEAGKAYRARVLARSPIARLTGFKA